MSMIGPRDADIASALADCIEANLDAFRRGATENIGFVIDLAQRDPTLCDASGIANDDLRSVWHFADTFFDAAAEGQPDADGLTLAEAETILSDVVQKLRAGRPVTHEHVLGYRFIGKGCGRAARVATWIQTAASRLRGRR